MNLGIGGFAATPMLTVPDFSATLFQEGCPSCLENPTRVCHTRNPLHQRIYREGLRIAFVNFLLFFDFVVGRIVERTDFGLP